MNYSLNSLFSRRIIASATALFCLYSPINQAAEGSLAVGLGAGYSAAEYKGVDNEADAIPIIEYEIGRFSFYALGASARLATFSSSPITDPVTGEQDARYKLHLLASVNVADGERDNDDSPIFANMEIREVGSSAGVSAVVETPFGLLSASHLADVSDSSDGSITSFAFGTILYANQSVFIGGNLGVTLFDENWNDYYYGVSDSEATSSRAAYQGSSSVNPFIGVSATYMFDRHWSLTQDASITKIDDNVIDSPLTVDDDTIEELSFTLRYAF